MADRRCGSCQAELPTLSAAERFEAAQEPVEHPDLCATCEGTPGVPKHVMVAGRCVYCGGDDHSLGSTPDCTARTADSPPLFFSTEPGARWVVSTETGSVYLFDLVGMTATRLPANTGGDPIPLTHWLDRTYRADGRLRADEQPVSMAGLPKPWPPVEEQPLQMVLELVPGVLTVRTTSLVTEAIMLDD
ncbi:hypothetical protein [Ornithinimicrobium murale]|uniref:hypothetical protein n=1 Tax=Ornithinimicrobium murale TaxID=1050153 RepID=UPI000E0D6879|nr:hypothetical protein [Ornithinimicrobium murale]